MSDDADRCILCAFPLFGSYTQVQEGRVCADSMGCRRRALRTLVALRTQLDAERERVRLAVREKGELRS